MESLPSLSRFELQCLRKLWDRGEATVRDMHDALSGPPSYSTVRKIVERLEEKGAVERVRKEGRAWVYRSRVAPSAMLTWQNMMAEAFCSSVMMSTCRFHLS